MKDMPRSNSNDNQRKTGAFPRSKTRRNIPPSHQSRCSTSWTDAQPTPRAAWMTRSRSSLCANFADSSRPPTTRSNRHDSSLCRCSVDASSTSQPWLAAVTGYQPEIPEMTHMKWSCLYFSTHPHVLSDYRNRTVISTNFEQLLAARFRLHSILHNEILKIVNKKSAERNWSKTNQKYDWAVEEEEQWLCREECLPTAQSVDVRVHHCLPPWNYTDACLQLLKHSFTSVIEKGYLYSAIKQDVTLCSRSNNKSNMFYVHA